jgi:NTE family protein
MKKACSILFFLFISISSKATYTHWVFEGAGIRGIAYVGALKALDEKHYLDSIQMVGGSSAGAITACFLALGYSPQEMEEKLLAMNFQDFNDNKFPLVSGIRNINKFYGWYEGRVFEKWIRGHIAARTGNGNITFKELHDQAQYKDLAIMGTSVNNQRSIRFDYETYPNMEVATAVRISMSIPYYFKAVCIDSFGHDLSKIPDNGYYDLCVDGGISSNLPVELFDVPQRQILAFQIVREAQLANKNTDEIAPYKVSNFSFFMKALYNLVMESRQSLKLKNYEQVKMIEISDGGIGPKIKKLKRKDVELLLNNGFMATKSTF